MKRTAINFFAAAVLVFGATAAFGQTATSPTNNNNITASVITNCTIGTFSLAFGSYDPAATAADTATSTIDVRCTKGTTGVSVTLDNGANASRRMLSATTSDYLDYEIFSDAGYTSTWPSATPGVTATFASAVVQTLNVYGRIPAHEAAGVAADYRDTVIATVNW